MGIESGSSKKQRYLFVLFDGRRMYELKLTPLQGARVFFYRNVRQQKIGK